MEIRDKMWDEFRVRASVTYILKNESNVIRAVAYDMQEPENLFGVTGRMDESIFVDHIPDWDFNVDDYLLSDLEHGFQIVYMPIGEHYNVWCAITDMKEDIRNRKGLHEYLKYCQTHDITYNSIRSLGLNDVNIMSLYKEENQGYRIIADYSVNKVAYVIGHDPKAPDPYVVWRTSYNRSAGYDLGHYYESFDKAFSDFRERIQDEVDKQVYLKRKCFGKEAKRDDAR